MLSHALLSAIALAVSVPAIAGPWEACDYSAQFDGVTCPVMLNGSIGANGQLPIISMNEIRARDDGCHTMHRWSANRGTAGHKGQQ